MIPWDQIQVRWIQGESSYAISNSLDGTPTRQAITKRSKREDWNRLPTVTDKHRTLSFLQLGRDTPENRRQILEQLSQGVSYNLVAGAVGVSRNTLLNWRKKDPKFAAQCQSARHTALAHCAARVFKAGDRDWKANTFILASAQESRDDYSQERGKEPLEIVINIDRSRGVTIDGKVVIDNEQESSVGQ